MPFKEGESGNPNGRPKGSKDKKTLQWDKFASWFMTDGMDRLSEEMAKLEGKDFVKEVKDLMEFFQPKLARTEIKHEADEGFKLEVGIKDDKTKADETTKLD